MCFFFFWSKGCVHNYRKIQVLNYNYQNYAEDYTEDLAIAHIRRLLDIVACTTAFSGSASSTKTSGRTGSKEPGSTEGEHGPDNGGSDKNKGGEKKSNSAAGAKSPKTEGLGGGDAAEKGDVAAAAMYPPPRLGQFYDFFSFSHLTPPIQCEFSFSLNVERYVLICCLVRLFGYGSNAHVLYYRMSHNIYLSPPVGIYLTALHLARN